MAVSFLVCFAHSLNADHRIIVGLYMLLTGDGEAFDVGKFLTETSPYSWGFMYDYARQN